MRLGLRLESFQFTGKTCSKGSFMKKCASITYIFLAIVATAGQVHAEEVLACETQSANFKRREYRCPLTANGREQQIRFKADFSGSHDDTQLSMNLTLDGFPVSCRKGSKTWLKGEDGEEGDVSLECHLVINDAPGNKKMLRATVNIYHAEFVGMRLSAR